MIFLFGAENVSRGTFEMREGSVPGLCSLSNSLILNSGTNEASGR